MKRVACCVWLITTLALPLPLTAQKAVFLVRHAERQDQSTDSPLSNIGRERAARLARMLKDSGITVIYTTQFQRTVQTAAPIAERLGVKPVVVASTDRTGVARRILSENGNDTVLVVGHSNSVPEVIKALGYVPEIRIADDEHDNIFLLMPGPSGSVTLIRLRF